MPFSKECDIREGNKGASVTITSKLQTGTVFLHILSPNVHVLFIVNHAVFIFIK